MLTLSWVNGSPVLTRDPCDPYRFVDPFDPWPVTHWPIVISAPLHSQIRSGATGRRPNFTQCSDFISTDTMSKTLTSVTSVYERQEYRRTRTCTRSNATSEWWETSPASPAAASATTTSTTCHWEHVQWRAKVHHDEVHHQRHRRVLRRTSACCHRRSSYHGRLEQRVGVGSVTMTT